METWLVVANCQTYGLANCLKVRAPSLTIQAADMTNAKKDLPAFREALAKADRVVANPLADKALGLTLADHVAVTTVPSLDFAAYHPDVALLTGERGFLKGPAGDYHSLILLAAVEAGLGLRDCLALFRGEIYEACGYFDLWASERDRLLQSFARHGLDLAGEMRLWGRGDAFMYTSLHPKIRCLYDLAGAVLTAAGKVPVDPGFLPPDNLATGPVYPVYPEIAEAYGVAGSLLFKPPQSYSCLTLEEFVAANLRAYPAVDFGAHQMTRLLRARFEHVKSVIARAI